MYKLSIKETGHIICILIEKNNTDKVDLHVESNNLSELAEEVRIALENNFPFETSTRITEIEKGYDEKTTVHFYPKTSKDKSEVLGILEHFLDPCQMISK